jgi:acyl dehydratase
VLYAEDFTVGDRYTLGEREVTLEAIKEFAGAWDPLSIHLDEEAAAAGPWGGVIASGLHTFAIAIRLVVDELVHRTVIFAGRETRTLKMYKPVRPGAVLTGSVEILETELRDNGRGMVVWQVEITDDAGDRVLSYVTDLLVHRRPVVPAG